MRLPNKRENPRWDGRGSPRMLEAQSRQKGGRFVPTEKWTSAIVKSRRQAAIVLLQTSRGHAAALAADGMSLLRMSTETPNKAQQLRQDQDMESLHVYLEAQIRQKGGRFVPTEK